jgi:hypothetical protein
MTRATDSRPTLSATDLMTRVCDGDGGAFRVLYDLSAPGLYTRLHGIVADRTEAARLLDETFRALLDRRAAYVRGADPLPWIQALADEILSRGTSQRRARNLSAPETVLPLRDRWAA